jgi:hypothetical protein
MTRQLETILLTATTVLVAGAALLLALFSLRWPLVHDLPIMLYEGCLIADFEMVPYRDFFDMNPPGTMFIYTLLHSVTDGEDVPLRLLDLSLVAVIAALTVLALRKHGWRAGVLASACFAIAYFAGGPSQALQREVFCVLLFAISAAAVLGDKTPSLPPWRSLIMGLCAGCAATIKTPVFLLWLPLLLFSCAADIQANKASRKALCLILAKRLVLFCLGMVVPIGATLLYLHVNGALTAYLDMACNYYPLYTEISGDGSVYAVGVVPLLKRYARALPLLHWAPISMLGIIGLSVIGRRPNLDGRRDFFVLILLLWSALLYVPLSGKFWFYHRIPLLYVMSLCAGLSVISHPKQCGAFGRSLVVLTAALALLPLDQLDGELWKWRQGEKHAVKNGTVEAVGEQLSNYAKPGDAVLPLDVTDGAIHALYKARIPLHGRFIYDFHFYHHVDHPYIRLLREEFMSTLAARPPDLVLQFDSWRPHGRTCSDQFPELQEFLKDYSMLFETNNASVLYRAGNTDQDRTNGSTPTK